MQTTQPLDDKPQTRFSFHPHEKLIDQNVINLAFAALDTDRDGQVSRNHLKSLFLELRIPTDTGDAVGNKDSDSVSLNEILAYVNAVDGIAIIPRDENALAEGLAALAQTDEPSFALKRLMSAHNKKSMASELRLSTNTPPETSSPSPSLERTNSEETTRRSHRHWINIQAPTEKLPRFHDAELKRHSTDIDGDSLTQRSRFSVVDGPVSVRSRIHSASALLSPDSQLQVEREVGLTRHLSLESHPPSCWEEDKKNTNSKEFSRLQLERVLIAQEHLKSPSRMAQQCHSNNNNNNNNSNNAATTACKASLAPQPSPVDGTKIPPPPAPASPAPPPSPHNTTLTLVSKVVSGVFGHHEVDRYSWVTRPYRPNRFGVHQDMDAPLSHYFISAGHNSYLTGNQLTSRSGVGPVKEALLGGCRVIELDVWNGKHGPKVLHGFTMTKPVSFHKCIKAVKKYAFSASDFPVIITIENHCNFANKSVMVKILEQELGHMLYQTASRMPWIHFPSPNELRGKILIRDKDDADVAFDMQRLLQEQPTVSRKSARAGVVLEEEVRKMGIQATQSQQILNETHEYTRLISIVNVKHTTALKSTWAVSSSKSEQLFEELEKDKLGVLHHTQRHLLRTYPASRRVDSSNYDPMVPWSMGIQIAALNWQTPGMPMWVQSALFDSNGSCGYVKKPDYMLAKDLVIPTNLELLRVRVLSARHLRHHAIRVNTVEVELVGSHEKDSNTFRTPPVKAFDSCTWDQEFVFPLRMPEMAVLVFSLYAEDLVLSRKEEFIGYFSIFVGSMSQGEFQLNLHNRYGHALKGKRKHTCVTVELQRQKATGKLNRLFSNS